MATFHLNLLGFFYFVLFIVHTFAYYSFRSKCLDNLPNFFLLFDNSMYLILTSTFFVAIDTPFDYLLNEPRMGRVDLRPFFCYCNVIVSIIALISILVMKIMLHMSGQDENAFDNETHTANGRDGQDSFSFMVSGSLSLF